MLLGRWEIWAGWRELSSPAEEDVLTDPLPEKEQQTGHSIVTLHWWPWTGFSTMLGPSRYLDLTP